MRIQKYKSLVGVLVSLWSGNVVSDTSQRRTGRLVEAVRKAAVIPITTLYNRDEQNVISEHALNLKVDEL